MRDPSTTHGRAITSFYVARRQCVKIVSALVVTLAASDRTSGFMTYITLMFHKVITTWNLAAQYALIMLILV
jgi:hypothetical protein